MDGNTIKGEPIQASDGSIFTVASNNYQDLRGIKYDTMSSYQGSTWIKFDASKNWTGESTKYSD